MFGKAVIRAHAFGHEGQILNIIGTNGKLYVMFVGQIVLDIDPPITYTYDLPGYQKLLFSSFYIFLVYGVQINLDFEVYVSIGGDIEIALQRGTNNSIQGSAALRPNAVASIEASAAVPAGVCYNLPSSFLA